MIPKHPAYLLSLVFILSWAVACQKVKPKPPAAEGFDDAIPPARSFLAGPITFQIKSLEDKINASLKPELVGSDEGDGGLNLRVVRTGRIRIKYANHKVTFSAPLQVWIDNPLRMQKKKHAENALCALSVDFQSPLQVAGDWRLTTRAQFVNYVWIKEPKVKVLGINIPVTRIADNILKKHRLEIEKAIDEAVYEGLRLDQQVRPVWLDLQKPLLLTKVPDTLWLVPTPFSVAVGNVEGNDKTLTVPIRVAFYTKTFIGKKPESTPNTKLPSIRLDPNVPQVSDLRVMSFISYKDINRIANKELKNKGLPLAKGLLTIKETQIYGGQRAVIIRADVKGAVNGTLYFRGKPAYDTLTHSLDVKNIDFDVETQERLLSTADWLLHDRLNDTLSRVLHFPIRDEVAKLPGLIEQAFEKGEAGKKNDIDIQTFQFVPQRIAVRPDGLQILLKVKSTIDFQVKQL